MDCEGLASGMYLVQLINGKDQLVSKFQKF